MIEIPLDACAAMVGDRLHDKQSAHPDDFPGFHEFREIVIGEVKKRGLILDGGIFSNSSGIFYASTCSGSKEQVMFLSATPRYPEGEKI